MSREDETVTDSNLACDTSERGAFTGPLPILAVLVFWICMVVHPVAPARAESPALIFEQALAAEKEARYEDALRLYSMAAERDDDNASVFNNRGIVHLKIEDFAAAVKDFSAASALDPQNPDVLNNRALALMRMGEDSKALDDLTRALALEPNHRDALMNRAHLHIKQGRPDRAVDDVRTVVGNDDRDLDARTLLAKLRLEQKECKLARRILQKTVKFAPDDAETRRLLGRAYYCLEEYDDALSQYDEAVRIAGSPTAEILAGRCGALLKNKEPRKALADCRESLRLDPRLPAAHYNLGLGLLNTGDADGAVKALTEAVKLAPDRAAFHRNRAIAYAMTGDFEKAREDFTRALTLEPRNVDVLLDRGRLELNARRLQAARADFTAAVALQPNNSDARHQLGLVLLKLEKPDEALTHLNEARRLDSRNGAILTAMGEAYVLKEEWGQAERILGRALRKRLPASEKWRPYALRALAHEKRGRTRRAIRDYRSAAEYADEKSIAETAIRAAERLSSASGR